MQTNCENDQRGLDVHIEKLIKQHHPWLEPWTIRVTAGMSSIVEQLLNDLETILGPRPKLRFLRIVEEPVNEELYQCQLAIFSEFPKRHTAKLSACIHAVKQTIEKSKRVCKACGKSLLRRDAVTEEEWEQNPYLQLMAESPFSRIRYYCPDCLETDWQVHRAFNQAQAKNAAQVQTNDHNITDIEVLTESAQKNAPRPLPTVTVIRAEDLERLEQENQTGSRDTVGRIKNLVKKIKSQPLEKRLTPIPDNWRENCKQLVEDYPNFAEVIGFLRNQMALSDVAGDRILRFAPFLMIGGPGVGKSDFMMTIADGFKTPIEIINVSNAQTGSALTGSEQYWSNAQTGTLFNSVVTTEVASPIICLDELDKARSDGSYNVLAALHQLLEPKQASRYADLSVPELRFDASHVLWIATANELEQIDKPIVDRFAVFNIADPNADQMRRIVTNQYRRFVTSHPAGGYFEPTPQQAVVDALCGYHPRQVRKTLQQCFGLAAYEERPYLTAEDVLACVPSESKNHHSGIGFLASIRGMNG